MSEIMSSKINVLDIAIDNCTAKEAMRETLSYMESDLVNVIELVTIDGLMELGTKAELKDEVGTFDLVLAGDKTILEAAQITENKCLRETEDKTFLKMFLRYLARKHKRIYLLVESEEEGQKMFGHFERYYRGAQIVGMAKVSAKNRADDMLINAINGEEVDCVLSALSSPLQEDLISQNRNVMNARIWMGLGKTGVPVIEQGFGTGKIGHFFMKQIFKKEIEKSRKRGN